MVSPDCINTFQTIIKTCQKKGIDCIAVTDHNEIHGAQKLAKVAPFKVIIGEEVKTTEGEIVGLFLKEKIAPHKDLKSTIESIRSQGGIVYLPHPHKMMEKSIIEAIDIIDIIEVFNGRNLKKSYNQYALELARRHNKLMAVGSDSHTPFEIGRVYFETDPFNTAEEFLMNLSEISEFHCRYSLHNIILNRLLLNHKVRNVLNRFTTKK